MPPGGRVPRRRPVRNTLPTRRPPTSRRCRHQPPPRAVPRDRSSCSLLQVRNGQITARRLRESFAPRETRYVGNIRDSPLALSLRGLRVRHQLARAASRGGGGLPCGAGVLSFLFLDSFLC